MIILYYNVETKELHLLSGIVDAKIIFTWKDVIGGDNLFFYRGDKLIVQFPKELTTIMYEL